MNFHTFYSKFVNWISNVGPKVLIGLVLLVIGFWTIRLLKRWFSNMISKHEVDSSLKPFLLSLITTVLQIVVILAVMQVIGVKMTIFAAFVGALGVAFGLALSGTLQNFTSGILILLLKPYKIGDNIVAQGQDGIVNSIQLFYTVIITLDNKTVIIPNSKLSNEVIVNISKNGIRRMDVEFKFNFSFDFEKIRSIIQDALAKSDKVKDDPVPEIGISLIEPDGYRIRTQAWVDADQFEESRFAVQRLLINALVSAGIKLPGIT
ncbi:mechanosensitive ion channel family protein [Danxiaibacter flavus]|uniref:Mechanosensitive ion channel family protein n=1 Tax=Danxiaibacter flavus TaxID=3049108 RepID=A0ABV3ZJN9_9BACT|nr:mechanosensitive ion channel family protein [Chitinophagaceae bacterium DXS]